MSRELLRQQKNKIKNFLSSKKYLNNIMKRHISLSKITFCKCLTSVVRSYCLDTVEVNSRCYYYYTHAAVARAR